MRSILTNISKSINTDSMRTPRTVASCCPPLLRGGLTLIAAQPSGEACVCHFTARLDLSQPTVSHHLKLLFDAGLLERERRGTWVYYRIIPEQLAALRQVLSVPEAGTTETKPRPKRRA